MTFCYIGLGIVIRYSISPITTKRHALIPPELYDELYIQRRLPKTTYGSGESISNAPQNMINRRRPTVCHARWLPVVLKTPGAEILSQRISSQKRLSPEWLTSGTSGRVMQASPHGRDLIRLVRCPIVPTPRGRICFGCFIVYHQRKVAK